MTESCTGIEGIPSTINAVVTAEAALLISTLPAHGQFTANDVRPPNNPAAKVLYSSGRQNGVKRDAENDHSLVRTGGYRLGSANRGVRSAAARVVSAAGATPPASAATMRKGGIATWLGVAS
jgi:hypothetical protein